MHFELVFANWVATFIQLVNFSEMEHLFDSSSIMKAGGVNKGTEDRLQNLQYDL